MQTNSPGVHLQVDVVESEQALSSLRAVTEADVAEPDLGGLRRNGANWAADRDRPNLSGLNTSVSREARVQDRTGGRTGRNRKLAGKFLNVRAH